MKHLHTITLCASLLCGASAIAPALALPTGSITSHSYLVVTRDQNNYVYIDVGTTVDNSLGNTTAYVEVADKMSITTPNDNRVYHAWEYGTDPKHFTVTPHLQQDVVSRFGSIDAVRQYSYLSEAYLAASDDPPYTGGTATILDTNPYRFSPAF